MERDTRCAGAGVRHLSGETSGSLSASRGRCQRGGGVLIDFTTNEVLLSGLSMPHSPRWYDDRLWVLNSGEGGIGCASPTYQPLAELPGFTRGLDFQDCYAFIGLSQIRESAVFSGIKIAERPQAERCCGVWVVDIVTGEIVAWVKFEDALQEIFAVCVVPNRCWPEITNTNMAVISNAFVLPDAALEVVPAELVTRVETSTHCAPQARQFSGEPSAPTVTTAGNTMPAAGSKWSTNLRERSRPDEASGLRQPCAASHLNLPVRESRSATSP